jgi:hypothetical protein
MMGPRAETSCAVGEPTLPRAEMTGSPDEIMCNAMEVTAIQE